MFPRSPDWDGDGESWSESEGLSSSDFSRAQCGKPCVACYWAKLVRRKRVSLFQEDWGHARVALSRHVALDLWCQEMHEAWSLPTGEPAVTARESLSLTVDGL